MSLLSKLVGKIPVVGGAINTVAHDAIDPLARGAVSAIPGGGLILSAGDKIGQMLPGGSSGNNGSIYSDGSGGDSGGIDWGKILGGVTKALPVVGGGLAAYEGIKNANQSNALTQKALDMAGQDYTDRAPLRTAALAKLTNPQAPDLSFATNTANPFAKRLPVVGSKAGS